MSTQQVCCDTSFSDMWLEFKHHLVDRSPWVHIYKRAEIFSSFQGCVFVTVSIHSHGAHDKSQIPLLETKHQWC